MNDTEEIALCDFCGDPVESCNCVCPFCGEMDDCECCLFDTVTGGG